MQNSHENNVDEIYAYATLSTSTVEYCPEEKARNCGIPLLGCRSKDTGRRKPVASITLRTVELCTCSARRDASGPAGRALAWPKRLSARLMPAATNAQQGLQVTILRFQFPLELGLRHKIAD